MKEYKLISVKKKYAEQLMNEMAQQGWSVTAVTYWSYWNIRLLVTFEREGK